MEASVNRLDVPGTSNFREVAPGLLVPGVLYRSDALHRLTSQGRRRLGELGIRRVIDLRSKIDRRIGGRDRLRGTGIDYVRVPIDGAPRGADPRTVNLRDVYAFVLAHHRRELGDVIRRIAESDGPIVVHCTAGKDRTGLVVALALSAVGIEREEILADYAATEANLSGEWTERMLRKLRRFRVHVSDDLLEVLAGSPPALLAETLDGLDERYGGVEQYLESAGVDPAVRARLRGRLLPGSV